MDLPADLSFNGCSYQRDVRCHQSFCVFSPSFMVSRGCQPASEKPQTCALQALLHLFQHFVGVAQ